ncbi:D-alanyl-D-alanine carboxypeptidase family protein [Microbacterium bovistercoris]|uniref:D-alanyl-D-alanine carboxypeptidase family protein n=1 Tax=Microbacterium bovistercoris TaxID=2293570 RepID=A0A371NYA0_9MICO|nr:M15 family metallopeptidase [Microbacterium bovistercoris]REJ08558.1 D-alanyl-D-alanine carboxypeptidase family protein [Microbacterium bovistercoris]
MSDMQPRHAASSPRAVVFAAPVGVLVTALASLWALASPVQPLEAASLAPPAFAAVMELPAVVIASEPAADPCAAPVVTAALASGDDSAVIAGFGGADAFRAAVVAGAAPCISLSDPAHVWVVVNKARRLSPENYAPASLAGSGLTTTSRSGTARDDVAAALAGLAAAAADAGAGRIGVNNAYRSYGLQVRTYGQHVRDQGEARADTVSARPGHSEHQTGLAADIVACSPNCTDIHSFGGTPQSDWVAQHAWEHGFIVRYEDGHTAMTGYIAEPWHVRYVGKEIAAAYHAGGFHTLEEFFGLPAAPDYVE